MSAILISFLFNQTITHTFITLNLTILIFNQIDDNILKKNYDY